MEKTFTTLEVLNLCTWYKQLRESEKKPLNDLPLKIQWTLKKNISIIMPTAENFLNFQQDMENGLREKYANDEKSYVDTDEDGQDIRKIKDEYLKEFQDEVGELNQKLSEILEENITVEIQPINIDNVLEEMGDKETTLSVDDLDMLALMN